MPAGLDGSSKVLSKNSQKLPMRARTWGTQTAHPASLLTLFFFFNVLYNRLPYNSVFEKTLLLLKVWNSGWSCTRDDDCHKIGSQNTFKIISEIKAYLCSISQSAVARQAPLCMGFPRQEYWSGLPFPSPKAYLYRKKIQS